MNLSHTAEFAALISAHSTSFIEYSPNLSDKSLGEFHRHSRARFHRWMRIVSDAESQFLHSVRAPSAQEQMELNDQVDHQELLTVARQILVSEMLTRVWVAALTGWDRRRNLRRAEPIARNVMLGHMLARHQVLTVLFRCRQLSRREVKSIDRLREKVQLWTDQLTAHMLDRYDLWDFAFDAERAREFAADAMEQDIENPSSPVWKLLLVSLRLNFPENAYGLSSTSEHDRRVVRSVLHAFPNGSLTSADAIRSLSVN